MAKLVEKQELENLLLKYYTITAEGFVFFDAYEGVNIKITPRENNEVNCHPKEYVLKLSKSQTDYIAFQLRMIQHLQLHDVKTIKPVSTVDGNFVFNHTFGQNSLESPVKYTVYMFHHVPGMTVHDAGNPQSLFSDIGRFTGKMDTVLKDFCSDEIDVRNDMWELTCVPEIQELLSQCCDNELKNIAQEIIDSYHTKIAPNLHRFQKGYIHGDVNNCNIIIQSLDTDQQDPEYSIAAIIDFGDACMSYYVYELAAIMADLMTSMFKTSGDFVDVGKRILKGYRECFELNNSELSHLRVIICVRLIQMYVLNSMSYQHNPDNKYVALEIEESGKVCALLWRMTESEFCSKFETQT